jgi:lysozyme family protein
MDPQGSTQTQNYPPAFARAIARLLGDEGGLVDTPADPGGETKFGISKREYPDLDIAALTRAGVQIEMRARHEGTLTLPLPHATRERA